MQRAEQISRRLKLRQLEVLLTVAQSGSMAQAADRLSITQPVISKTIADLEGTLGVRLFDRSSRGIEPTLYGRALLKRSAAIFNDLRTSVTELDHLADPTAGELRIGSSEAVAAGMLSVIIDRLSQQHPRLTFEVTLGGGLADLQYRELQAHNLDLIIGRLPDKVPDDTASEILYQDEVYILAGAKNCWGHRRRIDAAALANEPWCLPPLEIHPWTLTAAAFRAAGLDLPRSVVITRSVSLLTSLVATGHFLTALPRTVTHFCAKDAGMRVLPVNLHIEPYPVGIATLKNRTLTPAAQLFVACAREVSKPLARRK